MSLLAGDSNDIDSDRMSRSRSIELSEAKEVSVKVDIVIPHLDLSIA
jgi:hypothetical protein